MKSFKEYTLEYNPTVVSEDIEPGVNELIKSVGGGKLSESTFETWVYIVARLSGSKTKPTSDDIDKVLKESEIVSDGKKKIAELRKKFGDDRFLIDAIELIGGDIKSIPGIKWGSSVGIIHKSIDKYYKSIPDSYKTKGSKANTADMVFVTSGSVNDLLSKLPNSQLNWNNQGVITIKDTNISFVQVSLKKGEDNARIGKLNTLINAIYGQQAMRPTQLKDNYTEFSREELIVLEEGFFSDIFRKFKGKLNKVLDWAKDGLKKLKNSFLNVANRAIDKIKNDKAHKAASSLISQTGFTISEGAGDAVPINKPMLKEMKVLKTEIIAKDMVNAEYKKILLNVKKINSIKKGAVVIENSGTDPILEMNNFKRAADLVLERKEGGFITREELFPALKLCVNYASYKTFNTILEDMQKKISSYENISNILVELNAKLKAEAMFGDTELPLWIVYGTGGGAH